MNWKKIISAFGATGASGVGLVRAIPRDVNSNKAIKLARMGAEVEAAAFCDLPGREIRYNSNPEVAGF